MNHFADSQGCVLVVDDTPQNLQLVGEILEANGFDVVLATSGSQALEEVRDVQPDIILLDVKMPEMDGFEVCRRLKENTATAEIPVMFLTVHGELEKVLQGFELGGVDYITKPVHKAELLVRVRTHIALFHAQRRLEHQNHRLLELHREKNEFMGIIAHGMRNPLAGIRLSAELIHKSLGKEPPMLDKARHCASQIEVLTDRMTEIIQNCLNSDAIERGTFTYEPVSINLVELCRALVEQHWFYAHTKHITLEMQTSAERIEMYADRNVCKEVIENLLSNAIKYSPQNTCVVLSIAVVERSEYGGGAAHIVQISVQDEGPGINAEDLKKMFGKYARLSAKPTGGEHSTGLGLSIVKRMVTEMGGRVWCESEVGRGATFFVELPLKHVD
jgi:two-component system sensor histidine kinase/response regulator